MNISDTDKSKNTYPVHHTGSDNPAGSDDNNQFLIFKLNEQLYAFAILNIKEILEYGNVTKVPMMPDIIQGVINLRGDVIPVVNLACRFGMKSSEITKRTSLIIIEIKTDEYQQDIGVMVDIVCEVLEISSDNIRETPSFGTKIRPDFIRGMGKMDDGFIIILAENKVLSVEDMTEIKNLSMTHEDHHHSTNED